MQCQWQPGCHWYLRGQQADLAKFEPQRCHATLVALSIEGKAINDKVRLYGRIGQALLEARNLGGDAFTAIESVLPWADFTASVSEAQQLARPGDFDFLHLIDTGYSALRSYAPAFLEVLRVMNATGLDRRQFKDFDTYLVPTQAFTVQRQTDALRLSVATDCDTYLRERPSQLDEQLATVNRLAGTNTHPITHKSGA